MPATGVQVTLKQKKFQLSFASQGLQPRVESVMKENFRQMAGKAHFL
jgi:hypothetical protein